MSLISIEKSELQELIDERLKEAITNNSSVLHELLVEMMENIILGKAMEEAEDSEDLSEEDSSIFFNSLK